MTYESILERMNEKFTELSGYLPREASDIGIRIKLLAGELYALNSSMEWIRRQMFPHTATGEQLELHAAQRGLERRRGEKATGKIVFEMDMPPEFDVLIPAGTICTTADGSLRYVTSRDYTLHRGSSMLMADCEAEHSGKKYNIGTGKIKTIVTYFSVGLSIDNATSFTGGTDDESDEELRERIFESYRVSPNGANAAYLEAIAESVEGVASAHALKDPNTPGYVLVIVGGRGAAPSQEAIAQVRLLMEQAKPLGLTLLVEPTAIQMVDVSVKIKPGSGYSFDKAKALAEETITEFFLALSVAQEFKLSELGKALLETEGVDNYAFQSMEDVLPNQTAMIKLGTLTVTQL